MSKEKIVLARVRWRRAFHRKGVVRNPGKIGYLLVTHYSLLITYYSLPSLDDRVQRAVGRVLVQRAKSSDKQSGCDK